MGRPKIKIIDDSQMEEVKKKPSKKVVYKATEAKSEAPQDSVTLREAKGMTPELDSSATPQNDKNNEEDHHEASLQHDKTKKPQKPGKAKPRSKKYKEISEELDRNKQYPLIEAVDMAKKLSYAKFNATLEAHINTAQTGIRGLVSLPFASGKQLRILVFGNGAETLSSVIPADAGIQLEKSRSKLDPHLRGDDTIMVGNDEIIEEINKGKIDFDLVITTPEWMPKLAKIARILGPRGLMPNPKNGTIAEDLKKAVEGFQSGKTEYKTEAKAPVIHIAMGKLDQPNEELAANIKTLLQTLGKSRVKKVTLSATMGPGVKVDLTSI